MMKVRLFFWSLALTLSAPLLLAPPVSAQTAKQEPPQVNLSVSRNVAPGPKIRLALNTRNVALLRVLVYRLGNPQLWIRHLQAGGDSPGNLDTTTTRANLSWVVNMRPKNEKKNSLQIDVYRSRQVNLPVLPPGVYWVQVEGAGQKSSAVVNITNLAVLTKRSKNHLLAWVTDFRTGTPIKGATVALWPRKGSSPIQSGATGKDGSTLLNVTPTTEQQAIVVSRGTDNAGLVTSAQDPDGQLTMHFQTDRPIYRPGQKASWKAILRRTAGRGWLAVANMDCLVEVRDAKDVVLKRQTLKTNAIGTLAGEVELPEEGSLGQYSVVVSPSGKGYEAQYGSFSVAEYRKPEFAVTLSPDRKRYLAGEKVVFNLKASYYFGAAVPGATVRYIVRRSFLPFYDSSDEDSSPWYGGDGNLYARDTYGQNDVVADETADLDGAGQLQIQIPTPPDGNDATYSISATVVDGAKREVEASSSVPVYSAAKRISVAGEVSYVRLGYLMPLRVRVADLDGKPASGTVTLVLKKPVWNEKEGRDRYVEITRTKVLVPANGVAKATLPAQSPGELLVEATMPDGSGRTARTSFSFYAADPNYVEEKVNVQPSVSLKLDKKLYHPGDTAKVLVSTNVAKRPILAVVEGLDIWTYRVISAGTKSFMWPVAAKLEMTPNAYITAAQWSSAGLISDNAIMPLPDPSRKLKVSIQADKRQYRPGDKATYTVQTTDDKGAPISAEVAVGVVDEALYAVRPDSTSDLYSLFWALRPNIVTTSTSSPEEQSGGAYQRVNKMAGVRQQFLDTAFWNARVVTNAQGKATFQVPIPGNLTTWRATARAITGDTRVGIAKDSVTATRPITLRLATPRQFVTGDQLTLIASANNRTTQDRTLETALSAVGATISGPKVQSVQVKAGGEGRSRFPVTIGELPASGEVKFTGRTIDSSATNVNAADLSDALESRVKVVPNGIIRRVLQGGTLANSANLKVTLPAGHIEPATNAVLTLGGGVAEIARGLASSLYNTSRDTAPIAASRLNVTVLAPEIVTSLDKERLENIALLARYETGDGGWGWWEDDQSDPQNTAFVLSALGRARADGADVPESLIKRGLAGARYLYDQNQLGEQRALLAAAIFATERPDDGAPTGLRLLDEVLRRSENLSPYARLIVAQALFRAGRKDDARQIADDVLKDVVVGPDEACLRVGERPGWTATTGDATAAALLLCAEMGRDSALQIKLARYLANDSNFSYSSFEAQTVRLRALLAYAKAHPSARKLGTVHVSLNGQSVKVPTEIAGQPLQVAIPKGLWRDGDNTISVERNGGGEVFYSLETRVFIPSQFEFGGGVRVFRRYDAQNAGKAWDELKRPVVAGEPIRCTVVVWPSERADAMRVTEPLPAGFEYIEDDNDYGQSGEQEVRDGAIIHYVRGNGLPITFRYYIRAESAGKVTALPATAEVLRRPDERGNSDAQVLEVTSDK
ncbi:hypothetical protein IAD21_03278 [Abditibacteriota bacterium]|nr:hypothetical protein IAD21_03278 [Abditibacteriota bacterium]